MVWLSDMRDWLTERAGTTPQALALIVGEQEWTYGALHEAVTRYARQLLALGVEPGQMVGALLSNSFAAVCLVHALAQVGAVLAPFNTRLAAPELAWQQQKVGCRLLFYDEAHAGKGQQLGQAGCEAHHVQELSQPVKAGHTPLTRALRLDGLQAVVFTSGTTGRPKGAMLTFGNHFWSATASAFRLGVQANDRWLSCLPLYHVGGLAVLFRSCLYGTAVVLQQGFDEARFNYSLDTQGITMTSLVPTMLHRLLPTRDQWPRSLRLVLLGGAATTPLLAAACVEAGVPIAPTYGLTEAASQVATMLPTGVAAKPGCVGQPLMFTQVGVVDEAGQPVAAGEYGEIVVAGPTVMQGYYDDAEATARTLVDGPNERHVLHTGDIGYKDEEGDLWLVQRRSDIIVSGGENVYPAEVEAVLRQHPAVAEVCVVGVPHELWGEQVAAMVALTPGQTVGEAALQAFCREQLAGFKLPRRWRFVEQLPQTASGKVARKAVEELLRADVAP